MIRTMFAIATGYFSMVFLNSFIHLIISFYFRAEFALFGISNLPSTVWVAGVTLLQFVFGLLGGLLATTIEQKNRSIMLLGFILLIVALSLINYSMLSEQEPLWYLISAPLLKIGGIITGYRLQIKQTQATS